MFKSIASIVVVPLLLVMVGSAAYWAISNNLNLDFATAFSLILIISYLHIFEKIIPLKERWRGQRNEVRPDIYHFISLSLFSIAGNFASISLSLHLHTLLELETNLWSSLGFFPTFVAANILGEFFPYWYHRISHDYFQHTTAGRFLWKIHAIHHIPSGLNWRKTNWMHPINTFLNTVTKFFPLLLLGFSKEIVFAVGVTTITFSYLSHANVQARTGFLDYIFVTPHLHHFHHSVIREEAKNFGNVLPFWDCIFGTYFNRKDEVGEVGIDESTEQGYPNTNDFAHQLRFPFVQSSKPLDL